jgi:tripartite-type tricarboxylate transporter receptor subunit TctC
MTNLKQRVALGAMSLLTAVAACAADPFPSKPIRVIVPYPAGGVVDVQARAVTQRLAVELGQPVVVEPKPGANGNIAAEFVARAPADGYTLLISAPFLINNPLLESNLRWAPKDFTPVTRFSLSPSYFVVPASSPARTLREFVDMAKMAKPPLQFGEGGVGSTQSMSNELFMKAAGITMEPVYYKGAPPVVPDLINALVQSTILPSSVAYPQVKAGKLRALANISSRRSDQLPDVPTFTELGFPEATALSWYAFHAPAGTPPEVLKKLETALAASTKATEVRERLASAGGEEAYLGTADFVAFLKADAEQWEKIAKSIKK